MQTPGFSLTSVPPNVLLSLGKAFAAETPVGPHPNAGYDMAMFHILTHMAGEVIHAESGVPHLALAMKHLAILMNGSALTPINSTWQTAITQGAAFNASSVLNRPDFREPVADADAPNYESAEEPEEPVVSPPATPILDAMVNSPNTPDEHRESAQRLSDGLKELVGEEHPDTVVEPKIHIRAAMKSPEGFAILAEGPGTHDYFGLDAAQQYLGLGRSSFYSYLDKGYFPPPDGVIERKGRFAKVYKRDTLDALKLKLVNSTLPTGRKKPVPVSDSHKAALAAGRERIRALPVVPRKQVEDGTYWSWDTVVDMTGASRGSLGKLANEGHFPYPVVRYAGVVGKGTTSVAFDPAKIWEWMDGPDRLAFRNRAQRKGLANKIANGRERAADQRPVEEYEATPQEPPVSQGPVPLVNGKNAEARAQAIVAARESTPRGWLDLRAVAAFLGLTESSVERMIREGKFMRPHRMDPKSKKKEWGARQVVKWRRDHITNGQLAVA